jgi:dihydrofolate reductase
MSKVIAGFSMSLDGFVADPDDGVDQVFKWYSAGGTDAEVMTGDGTFEMSREGAEFIEEAGQGAGVLVTARRTFDLAHAWGGKHPMDVPMVVVTHRVPEEWAGREGSPFTFVTEGVPKAIDTARQIAGDKDVVVGAPASPGSACNSGSSMPSTSTSHRWCWDAGFGSSIT